MSDLVAAGLVLVTVYGTLTWLVSRGIAQRIALDHPNARSLHDVPTPRVGGLVLVAVALVAWLALAPGLYPLALIAGGLSLFSFFDDLKGLRVTVRLVAHLAAAIVACRYLLPDSAWWQVAGLAMALAWLTNLYNFMDGADGLAGGMTVTGFGAYAAAGYLEGANMLATPSLMVAVAAAGFLGVNFPPARVFLGDSGSVPLGFLAGALGLAGVGMGVWPAWFPILVFSPFIVDASVTLVRRLLRGDIVWQAHREHAYQRLVRAGWTHRRLVAHAWPLMAGVALVAVLLRNSDNAVFLLLASALIYAGLFWAVEVRWSRHDRELS